MYDKDWEELIKEIEKYPFIPSGLVKNKHGVEGKYKGLGRFVKLDKNFNKTPDQYDFIPKCCLECGNLDVELGDYGSQLTPYYCEKNIFFPTKKGTCRGQDKLPKLR